MEEDVQGLVFIAASLATALIAAGVAAAVLDVPILTSIGIVVVAALAFVVALFALIGIFWTDEG